MLNIADKTFTSRLFLGTGKFASSALMAEAAKASGSQLVTVALKRVELSACTTDDMIAPLLHQGLQLLPNTSGARTAAEAILAAELSREALQTNWLKLEIHPIGSNRGLDTRAMLRIIIAESNIPVVVDAGLGSPSHAAECMEMGADAVLVNTAIAVARDPVKMAHAFRLGVEAGREAYLAKLAPQRAEAEASSPLTAFLFD